MFAKEGLTTFVSKIEDDAIRADAEARLATIQFESGGDGVEICMSGAVEEAFKGSPVNAACMAFYRALNECWSEAEVAHFGGREGLDQALRDSAPYVPKGSIPKLKDVE